ADCQRRGQACRPGTCAAQRPRERAGAAQVPGAAHLRQRPAVQRHLRHAGAAGRPDPRRPGLPLPHPLPRGVRRPAADRRRAVLPPAGARLPDRRRRLRGRVQEPRARRRRRRGQRAAGRLRPDGRRERLRRRRQHHQRLRGAGRLARPAGAGLRRLPDGHEPAGGQGVRQAVRGADVRLRARRRLHDRVRPLVGGGRRPATGRERRLHRRAGARPDEPHGPGLRLPRPAGLRLRVHGAHRRGGHRQRRAGLPQAQEQERGDHAGPDGRHRHGDVRRHHGAGDHQRRALLGGPRTAVRRLRRGRGAAQRHRPGLRGRLRRRQPRLLLPAGHGGRHPDPGREHRLQRLPAAGLDPRAGPLPAAAAAHPRRPAGLQQRHPAARGLRRPAHRGVRGQRHAADPALHHRGVHLVHLRPGRHGPALEPAARPGRGAGRRAPPRAAQPGHQRRGRRADRARAGHRDGHEVHPRRLPRADRDADPVPAHARHPPPLRAGGRGARARRRDRAAAQPQPCDRPGLEGAQPDAARPRVRPGDPAARPHRAHRLRRPGRVPGAAGAVGAARAAGAPDDHRVALPRDHPPGPRLRPRRPAVEPARRRDGVHPRVRRRALVGAAAAQPERPAPQDAPALPAGGDGDQRGLPAALLRAAPRRRRRRLGARRRAPSLRDPSM
ncbi:MAG: Uncharacterized amino acid permease, GabP family, partial [uncultured Frankineae bacterium]